MHGRASLPVGLYPILGFSQLFFPISFKVGKKGCTFADPKGGYNEKRYSEREVRKAGGV